MRSKNYFFLIFLPVIAFIIYSNTFKSPFILDDHKIITDNPSIKKPTIFYNINQPRYIGYITFAFNYKFNGNDVYWYHLINLLIHLTNSILVFFIIKKIFEIIYNREIFLLSFFVALIFIAHPIQTQAVTYIVQRFTSLAALFSLISIYSYLIYRTCKKWKYCYYLLFLFSALLAFKTKENTASLPIAVIAIEFFLFKNLNRSYFKRALLILPSFVLVAVIPLSFTNISKPISISFAELMGELKEASYETPLISRSQYLLTEFSVIMTYFRLLILPINQSLHYIYPLANSFFELKTFLSFSFIMVLLISSFFYRKKGLEITIGALWFFIFLSVESSIIPIQDVIFEHRLYLPSIGFFLAIVSIISRAIEKIQYKLFVPLILIIAISLSFLTYKRNEVWKDEITIWRDVINKFPTDHVAWSSLGTAYAKEGLYDEAIDAILTGFKYNSNFAKAHNNLAICYTKKGMIAEAIREYKIAISQDANNPKFYYNFGGLYYEMGDYKKSLELLKKAFYLNSEDPGINALLGSIYCAVGNSEDAINYFRRSINYDPFVSDIYYNFGICLMSLGRYTAARENFLKAIKLKPNDVDNYYFIADSYYREGDIEKAVEYYIKFLRFKPKRRDLVNKAELRLQEIKRLLLQ